MGKSMVSCRCSLKTKPMLLFFHCFCLLDFRKLYAWEMRCDHQIAPKFLVGFSRVPAVGLPRMRDRDGSLDLSLEKSDPEYAMIKSITKPVTCAEAADGVVRVLICFWYVLYIWKNDLVPPSLPQSSCSRFDSRQHAGICRSWTSTKVFLQSMLDVEEKRGGWPLVLWSTPKLS